MDPAQKPAEPLPTVKPADLVRQLLGSPETDGSDSVEAKENRGRAAAEISMIFELKDSTAFKWFEHEFIDGPYRRAFDELRSPHVKPEDLPKLQTTYVALRAIKVGMLEREIAHREQIDPNDVEVARLRAELAQL